MKKIYLSITAIIALTLSGNSQVIFESNFDEPSYTDTTIFTTSVFISENMGPMESVDQTVQDDITHHPDWLANHFNRPDDRAATWRSNDSNQIITSFGFAYLLLDSEPITAVDGDIITITTEIRLGLDTQSFSTDASRAMNLIALSASNTPEIPDLGANREGVVIRSLSGTDNIIDLADAGANAFATNPSISQEDKSIYEVIIEITVGSDASSSTKNVRLRNTSSNETSDVAGATGGLRPAIYDALTGEGAYYFNWTLGFFEEGNIDTILLESLKIEKNATTSILSISDINKTDISASIYPNPAKSELTIADIETDSYKVINLSGATVLDKHATGSLDVSSLSTGIYFLVTDSGTTRFVKQ